MECGKIANQFGIFEFLVQICQTHLRNHFSEDWTDISRVFKSKVGVIFPEIIISLSGLLGCLSV